MKKISIFSNLSCRSFCLRKSLMTGREQVDPAEWFSMAGEAARATRATADPLNIRVKHGRLEVRRNFFTARVTEQCNQVPTDIKNMRTSDAFRNAYAHHRAKQVKTLSRVFQYTSKQCCGAEPIFLFGRPGRRSRLF